MSWKPASEPWREKIPVTDRQRRRIERLERQPPMPAKPRFDLSPLSDEELATLEGLLEKNEAGEELTEDELATLDRIMAKAPLC